MTEIQRYEPAADPVLRDTDSWVTVIAQVGDLASKIAGTDFVPESMRGKPAAVAAAILTGREMGIGPMVAMRHIHLVKGKPGQSAELMRALVLSCGHDIRYVETNDTRVVVEGRRRGEEEWTRVQFTADQAKKASINLGGYPEDKLVARATARLCRRVFADVVAGMPYTTEELEDLPDSEAPAGSVAKEAEPARRTARRRTSNRVAAKPAESTGTATADATPPVAPEPPLPGEDGYDEPAEPVTGDAAEDTGGVTRAQLTRLHATMSKIGISDKAERLRVAATIVGRPLASSTEMGIDEAGVLIDTLSNIAATDDPAGNLDALMAEMNGADDEPVDAEIVDDDQGGDQ